MQPSFRSTVRPIRARSALAAILTLAAAAALALGVTGAFASSVKNGNYLGQFKYHGTLITSEVLTFKVSGNTVKKARITPFLPNKCGAGGPPLIHASMTRIAIIIGSTRPGRKGEAVARYVLTRKCHWLQGTPGRRRRRRGSPQRSRGLHRNDAGRLLRRARRRRPPRRSRAAWR